MVDSLKALKAALGRMVKAELERRGHVATRDEKIRDITDKFKQKIDPLAKLISDAEPEVKQYILANLDEVLPGTKKSGVVGMAAIEVRTSPGALRTLKGEETDDKTVLEAVKELAQNHDDPKVRKQLLGCVVVKETVDKAALKKIDPDVLKVINLKVHTEEIVKWEPNGVK